MSLESWKAEFYPIEASDVRFTKEAIRHSLKKWQGLTKENLEKHGVVKKGDDRLYDGIEKWPFHIDCFSCALCQLFNDENNECHECPLNRFLGYSCDEREEIYGPYSHWMDSGDPQIMIDALQKLEDEQ